MEIEEEKKLPEIPLNFDDPAQARKFLRDFRTADDKPLHMLEFQGKQFFIDLMSDAECIFFAPKIYKDLFLARRGYCEETTVH